MTFVSLVMPAWKLPSLNNLTSFLMDTFSQAEDNIEYYEIVPISREQLHACKNVAVKFKSSDFNLMNLEGLTNEIKQLKVQLDRAKETIRSLSQEYSTVVTSSSTNKEAEQQKAIKRTKKIKQLDEENKKLKTLLRSQLENSEKLRLETHVTIETLKEEFELLVKELTQLQKKSAGSTQGSSLSFEGLNYKMEALLGTQQGKSGL